MRVNVTITLKPETYAIVLDRKKETGLSISKVIEELVVDYLIYTKEKPDLDKFFSDKKRRVENMDEEKQEREAARQRALDHLLNKPGLTSSDWEFLKLNYPEVYYKKIRGE